jgi:translocation and assembly module TamB
MDAPEHTPAPATPARRHRWPRRVAIGAAVVAALAAGAWWYGGREATLQEVVRRLAGASGGHLTVSGVTGSLYGHMHLRHIEYRTPQKLITLDNVDIDWSPGRIVGGSVAIDRLQAQAMLVRTLAPSPPAPAPQSLAPPLAVHVAQARIGQLTLASGATSNIITGLHFGLDGTRARWQLRDAGALTPWGQLAAHGQVDAARPFAFAADARMTQTEPPPGTRAAFATVHAGGSLERTELSAHAQAGPAQGDARATLAPFAPVPLQALALDAHGIDPDFFNPALPRADVKVALRAPITPARQVSGSLAIDNEGHPGPINEGRLPLVAVRAGVGGTLDALRLTGMLLDLGAAGRFTGNGQVEPDQAGGTARFAMRTDGIDLKALDTRLKSTRITGTVAVASTAQAQSVQADLRDANLRLEARANLANGLLKLERASLEAGGSRVALAGQAHVTGTHDFDLSARTAHFNPASFGDLPRADVNAVLHARGSSAPAAHANVDFTIAPSRLFGQSLSGHGKLVADARHVAGVDASLALGPNSASMKGSFGLPGEHLDWRAEAHDLSALRAGLYGALRASGSATGSYAAPRTSFAADATGVGWAKAARKGYDGTIHATGETWRAAGALAVKASGTLQRLDPAAFGSPLAGAINGSFGASARTGAHWQATTELALERSQLSGSPLWGHANVAAEPGRIGHADVELHVGANIASASGSFGGRGDRLAWKLDAPQLAALGPDFAGSMRGAGSLGGSAGALALDGRLDAARLRIFGHQLDALHASATLGAGRGAADPLAADATLAGYSSGTTRLASAHLHTDGTRGAHALTLDAANETMRLHAGVQGGWSGAVWSGTVGALQNQGRYAFTLRTPVPLRIGVASGAGAAGLLHPELIALRDAVVRLPSGSLTVQTLDKDGGHWSSSGGATGVPLAYLAQFSDALHDNVGGTLTLGARWALDLHTAQATGRAPALAGMLHVYRESGDMTAGADVPVPLGLAVLDLRADVEDGTLRTRARIEGTRAGVTHVDASARLLDGRLADDSPLQLSAQADMASIAWLAPLAGQPGLELDGALHLALTGRGTVGAPDLDGTMNGDALAVRWPEQGVKLRDGVLRASLAGDQLQLQRLSFAGPQGGTASAAGTVRFAGGAASMDIKLSADKLEALSRPDRTVVVTGTGAVLRDTGRFQVNGDFTIDRAMVELAPQDRPTLSDDIIVLGRTNAATAAPAPAGQVPLGVDLHVDLGNDFTLRGMGLEGQLEGAANVRISGHRPPRVTGNVRVVNGTYAAYGQHLAIERGLVSFTGAYDNPSLNILAVRKPPNPDEPLTETNVKAGVEVRGTAQAPAAKLVSTPNVSESDKLAWLVLGHNMDATAGQEAGLLSAAAGALFGGTGGGIGSRVANSLGVDELGLSQAKGLESTVVTVGKRISKRAYLTFEQGAGTATSLIKLRYKVNPRITLQFQTGANTALDVLYSWAFD